MIYHWTFNLIVKRKSIERTGGGANKIVVLWWDRTRILQTWNKEEKVKTLVGFEPATLISAGQDTTNWAINNNNVILVIY